MDSLKYEVIYPNIKINYHILNGLIVGTFEILFTYVHKCGQMFCEETKRLKKEIKFSYV